MSITITATFECATIDEFTECLAIIRDNEPATLMITGSVRFIPDADQTPPFGIARSEVFAKAAEAIQDQDVHEWPEMLEEATQLWVHALVAWVSAHITAGPLTEVSDMTMYQAFRRFHERGVECGVGDLTESLEQDSCLRGAFRDAKGAQVPL